PEKQKKFLETRIDRVYYGKESGAARKPDSPEPPPLLAQSQRKSRATHQHRHPSTSQEGATLLLSPF
ncbi:TPA: hypothetical protein ACHK53_002287, partial [Escherichia coli]